MMCSSRSTSKLASKLNQPQPCSSLSLAKGRAFCCLSRRIKIQLAESTALSPVAVGTLNAVLILADQAKEVPQNRAVMLRVPRDREAHVEVFRNQRRDYNAAWTQVTD